MFGLILLCAGCGEPETASAPVPPQPAYDRNGQPLRPITRPPAPPNLVVIVIDALRHDAVTPGGDPGEDTRMPHLAALAARGVSFRNAVAPAPWTLPSVTSMLTGLQPSAHGLHTPQSRVQLVEQVTTFAEILRNTYGYDTAAFTAGPWFVGSGESVLQGFSRRQADFSLREAARELRQWARMRSRRQPYFLLLHTYDVHEPYGQANHPWPGGTLPDVKGNPALVGPHADAGEIFRRCHLDAGSTIALRNALGRPALAGILHRYAHSGYAASPRPELGAELAGAYWSGARWADDMLAQTTAWLGRQGLLHNTLLVVTSDHGEGFGEHGSLAHGRMLYDELIRIPLVMLGPEPFVGGEVVTGSVGLVDILPMFFDWAGLEAHVGIAGRSQLALLEEDRTCRPVLSEERLSLLNTGEAQEALRLSARTEHWKYIVTYDLQTGSVREEVYDVLIDPEELDDLTGGTGRLPAGLVFDDCFCAAVSELRARIWGDRADEEEPAQDVPYRDRSVRPTTPVPTGCVGQAE